MVRSSWPTQPSRCSSRPLADADQAVEPRASAACVGLCAVVCLLAAGVGPALVSFLRHKACHATPSDGTAGCGPVPVLSERLTSAGFPCVAYDPFFAPDDARLATQYDYVTCFEVAEHARDPANLFATLRHLLAPGALLGAMTRFYGDEKAFADWWYRRDPTHVCFYTESTVRWTGEQHEWRTDFPQPNVTRFTTTDLPKNDVKPYGSVGAPPPG